MSNSPKHYDLVYTQHVFICTNEREAGLPRGSDKLRTYVKAKAKELGLDRARIKRTECLERCELGPNFVIYPEGVWYKCETTADVDHVLIEHMKKGNYVNGVVLEAKNNGYFMSYIYQ